MLENYSDSAFSSSVSSSEVRSKLKCVIENEIEASEGDSDPFKLKSTQIWNRFSD